MAGWMAKKTNLVRIFWSLSSTSTSLCIPKIIICWSYAPPLLFLLLLPIAHTASQIGSYNHLIHHQQTNSHNHHHPHVASSTSSLISSFGDSHHQKPNQTAGGVYQQPLPVPAQPTAAGGWTPLLNHQKYIVPAASSLSYTAINPSSSAPPPPPPPPVITKVIPLVTEVDPIRASATEPAVTTTIATAVNLTSKYLAEESVARSSYQKPLQNTYMIHPAKYQQAFSSSSRSNRTSSKKNSKHQQQQSQKSNKMINSDGMPIPMIKPHRHGATLGFNLPDQGLTLYLDINELATKPMAQNIGLKVVSHNDKRQQQEQLYDLNTSALADNNETITTTERPMPIAGETRKVRHKTSKKVVVKKTRLRNKTGNNTGGSKASTIKVVSKSKKTGRIMSPVERGNKAKLLAVQQQQSSSKDDGEEEDEDGAELNQFRTFNSEKIKSNRSEIPPSASRIPPTYASQTYMTDAEYDPDERNIIQQQKETETSTDRPPADRANSRKARNENSEREFNHHHQQHHHHHLHREAASVVEEDDNEPEEDVDVDPASLLTFDTAGADDDDDEEEEEHHRSATTALPLETTTTYWLREKNNAGSGNGNNNNYNGQDLVTTDSTIQLHERVKKQETIDNELLAQMEALLEKSTKLIDLSAATCASRKEQCRREMQCMTRMDSVTSNTSTTIREIGQRLEANLILNEIPGAFERELQDFMDFSAAGYTIILPSNSAVRLLPPNLIRRWKQNLEDFSLNAYLIEGRHTMASLLADRTIMARNRMKLFISNPFNGTYTINGQRVLYGDQRAPNNGLVHVVEGLLYPSSDKNIMDTLKSCGKFDGFVTLSEGTGFAETLKKEGPFTVFVPSNDALQKVPDSDLEIIRRNMTALKEFLMYHVAEGAFYSQDLMDGQYLPSILDGQYLQAGVRVDGCSRRLVEINVSPLYRADIPASNGVIHVVDWILKPDDRDWCNGIILPRRR